MSVVKKSAVFGTPSAATERLGTTRSLIRTISMLSIEEAHVLTGLTDLNASAQFFLDGGIRPLLRFALGAEGAYTTTPTAPSSRSQPLTLMSNIRVAVEMRSIVY
jgi:hypothetical protein